MYNYILQYHVPAKIKKIEEKKNSDMYEPYYRFAALII